VTEPNSLGLLALTLPALLRRRRRRLWPSLRIAC
jgi:hypothetical protein